MAHKVKVTLGEMELSRQEAGPVFSITKDGEVLGDLRVSKGGIRWRAKHEKGSQAKWHVAKWSEFADFMASKPRK